MSAAHLGRRAFCAQLARWSSWPAFAAWARAAAVPTPNAPALILLWLDGGASHLETFDPKPNAPSDVRGPFATVAGVERELQICGRLPRVAQVLDRCVLLRGISSGEGNHDRAASFLLSGHRPSPVLQYPGWPCWIDSEAEFDAADPLPRYVAISTAPAAAQAGFLGAARAPVVFDLDWKRARLALPHLEAPPQVDGALALAEELDRLGGAPLSAAEALRERFRKQALALSRSEYARAALDLRLEPAELRARYGMHAPGQALLAARRLIDHGARTVLVHWTGWDHHRDIAKEMGYGFPAKLDALDEGLSALVLDLEAHGPNERVLVAVLTEFGRTPRLNLQGGRDHWPRASAALLYGAGLRRGVVCGATDARGEEPLTTGISPAQVGATILQALGVDPTREVRTPSGRPIALVEKGAAVLREVLR